MTGASPMPSDPRPDPTVRLPPDTTRAANQDGAVRLRNTRQAASVEAALREADGFRTAQHLFAELRQRGDRIGLTTVYRHLNQLAEQGSADVVHTADGEAQFRLCGVGAVGDSEHTHHHHLVCRVCGRSVEVSGPEVEAWADQVARQAGYTEITHTLEVFGLCPEHSRV